MTHPTAQGVSPWTPALKCQLAALWMQAEPKLSTAEIGRAMGISKNAVVGMAHRMNLPPRQSPIIRVYARRQVAVTPAQSRVLVRLTPECVAPAPVAVKRATRGQCSWPDGTRGNYRECQEVAFSGRSYCDEHCARAYVRQVRLEEAS